MMISKSTLIAVLMGGVSAEREVSLNSGKAVLNTLKQNQHNVVGIDFDETGLEQLIEISPDLVINMLHGKMGEDGTVQGILDYLNIPHTGSSVKASALTMDKLMTKQLLIANQIPTPKFMRLNSPKECEQVEETLGFPIMIKPIFEGSSVGMSRVDNAKELISAFELAHQYGTVMAERLVEGQEYTVGFVGDEILPIIELQTDRVFYDYEAKYLVDDTRYLCPCEISDSLRNEINSLVKQTIECCDVTGWGRVDLMCEGESPQIIEINTVPGMTDHSLVPMAAKQAGYDFYQLVINILETIDFSKEKSNALT